MDPMTIEIAPGFTIGRWNELKTGLDRSGKWSNEWNEVIDKIELRFQKRFFEPATQLQSLNYAGFAILALDCLLIESLQAFISGDWTVDSAASRRAFKQFLKNTPPFSRYFPDDSSVDPFYDGVRIGLLHDGETRSGWLVRTGNYELVDRTQHPCVIVNRDKFHSALHEAFREHFKNLRQPAQEQDRFRGNLCKAIDGLRERSLPDWRPPRKSRRCERK